MSILFNDYGVSDALNIKLFPESWYKIINTILSFSDFIKSFADAIRIVIPYPFRILFIIIFFVIYFYSRYRLRKLRIDHIIFPLPKTWIWHIVRLTTSVVVFFFVLSFLKIGNTFTISLAPLVPLSGEVPNIIYPDLDWIYPQLKPYLDSWIFDWTNTKPKLFLTWCLNNILSVYII